MIARMVPDAHFSRRFDGTIKGTVAFMRAPASDCAGRCPGETTDRRRRYAAQAPVEIAPLEKAQAFMRLVDHSSNYLTLLETGFDTLASLVEACDHFTLPTARSTRPFPSSASCRPASGPTRLHEDGSLVRALRDPAILTSLAEPAWRDLLARARSQRSSGAP